MGATPSYLLKLLEGTHRRMGLALAALTLGKESDPRVDVKNYMNRIFTLAGEICDRLPAKPATGDVLFALNTHLFDELKFTRLVAGNNGREPFIHSLLDERQGEAVSFVIFYLTLGRLLNLPLEGVSISGRLLLRLSGAEDVIDPCAGGVVLTGTELKSLLEGVLGGKVMTLPPFSNYLEKMDDRAILVRLLRRYKEFYLSMSHYSGAISAVEAILHIVPGASIELLEHGQLLEAIGCPEKAAAVYFHYIEHHPGSSDIPRLRERLRWLLGRRRVLH